jgi:hypothetical protein
MADPVVDRETRTKIVERMRAGEKSRALAEEFKLNPSTVRAWYANATAEPKGVPPPSADAGKKGAARYKSSGGRRPITEQTAGMLCSGLFTLAAIVDGPAWILSQSERDALAGPLADSMRALPTPIADGVNTYAAPITFGTTLATIVAHKVRVRGEKGKKPPAASDGGPPPPPPQQTPRPPPPQPFAAAPPASNGRIEPALAEALEAARGGLTGLDPMEDAEAAFA